MTWSWFFLSQTAEIHGVCGACLGGMESAQGPRRGAAFQFEGVKIPLKTLMKVLALSFRKKKKKSVHHLHFYGAF